MRHHTLLQIAGAPGGKEMPSEWSSWLASAGARGVVFQLCESLGVLSRRPIEDQLAKLGDDDRKALARLGVRVGVYSIYFPSMLKPVPIRLRAGIWRVRAQAPRCAPFDGVDTLRAGADTLKIAMFC